MHIIVALVVAQLLGFILIAQLCPSFILARKPGWVICFHVSGLPGLTGKAFELAQQGNLLADWTATIATAAHGAGAWLAIEDPTGSFLWVMEKIKQVHALTGVVFIQLKF